MPDVLHVQCYLRGLPDREAPGQRQMASVVQKYLTAVRTWGWKELLIKMYSVRPQVEKDGILVYTVTVLPSTPNFEGMSAVLSGPQTGHARPPFSIGQYLLCT